MTSLTHNTDNPDSAPSGVDLRVQHAEDLLAGLQPDSVAAIVTDPPFGISYQSNHRKGVKTRPVGGDWQVSIGAFFTQLGRVLRIGGAAYVCTRWDVLPSWQTAVARPLKVRNVIAWDKGNHTAGDLTGNFGYRWEAILFITKGRHALRGRRWPNLWQIPRVPATAWTVPTEKPVALFQRCIEASTDPGDLVADPYCGSGTLGVAAAACGRSAMLCDIDPEMIRIAAWRCGLPNRSDLPTPVQESAMSSTLVGEIDLSPLDGLHPEDVVAVAEYLRHLRINR